MSNNTQKQGRTLFSERDFTFTPRDSSNGWGSTYDASRVGDDANRSLYRWEQQLYSQLNTGNVTKDANAKLLAMKYGGSNAVATASPATVAVGNKPVNVALTGGLLLSTVSMATPSSVSATSGNLPAGTSLALQGQKVVLNGTPTAAGAFTFSATVVTDNGTVVVPVTGTITP